MTFLNDLRYALRMLARGPGLALTAVLTIGVGIAATAVIFAAIDSLLLKPLPIAEPDGLVAVTERLTPREEGLAPRTRHVFDYPRYAALRDGGRDVLDLAGFIGARVSLRAGEEAEVTEGLYTSANYFDVLGVRPAVGRFFSEGVGRDGEDAAVVVLGEHVWQRDFGGDPSVMGRTVHINGQPVTVIGVAPRGFHGTMPIVRTDFWLPLEAQPLLEPHAMPYTANNILWMEVFGRLAPGTGLAQAQEALSVVSRGLDDDGSSSRALGAVLEPLRAIPEDSRGAIFGFMALLQAASAVVLLIASVNVAGVLLARASARRREIAVRLALGASRGRLVRQFLVESTLLFSLGGAAGLLLAVGAAHLLSGWRPPPPISLVLDLSIDARVVAVAMLAALLTGLIFGLAPALQSTRPALVPALKEGSTGGDRRRTRLRAAFVVGQLAMLMLLISVTGLFVRSIQNALGGDLGFEYAGVVTTELDPSLAGYDAERGALFFEQFLERARQIPGVRSASLAAGFPAASRYFMMEAHAPGAESGEADRIRVGHNVVATDYFRTLRIPLLAGRDFDTGDRAGAQPVAIVNESLARRAWPGEDPIGRELRIGNDYVRVVGLVKDGRTRDNPSAGPEPYVYRPVAQFPNSRLALVVHAPGAEARTLAAIRAELRALDPNLPPISAKPLVATIGLGLLPQRIAASAIGGFGLVGLLLAALGLYGIIAFQVTQRTREIGVRIALGAHTGEVVQLVLRQGLGMIAAGLGLGLVLALGASRLISGMLYGTGPLDFTTYLAASLLLVAVGLAASWLPARRAASIDPMSALKAE